MKLRFLPLPFLLSFSGLQAEERGKLVFSDDFERNETDEAVEEIGNSWFTNSEGTANGAKQADLRDGALHIETTEKANHRVSVRKDIELNDGTVEMKVLLPDKDDVLVMDFADPKEKSVHAGHLFSVTVGADQIDVEDLKTGRSSNAVSKARKSGQDPKELKKLLKTKKAASPAGIGVNEWHLVAATLDGSKMTVFLDGEEVVKLDSEGFAHPTKRLLRIAVPKTAMIDDVKIYSKD